MKKYYKYRYLILFTVIFLVLVIMYLILNIQENTYVSNINKEASIKTLAEAVSQDDYVVQNKKEDTEEYNIEIYYPLSKYDKLNNSVNKYIEQYLNVLNEEVEEKKKNNVNQDIQYMLDINFNYYTYLNYISFVFYATVFNGGAHPNTYIHTIVYDKNNDNIIDIDTLIKKDKNVLDNMSKISYDELYDNERIKGMGTYEMLEYGTKATKENFENFVLTADGVMIFFEKYQVAPYVSGEFTVTIPYDKLNLKF